MFGATNYICTRGGSNAVWTAVVSRSLIVTPVQVHMFYTHGFDCTLHSPVLSTSLMSHTWLHNSDQQVLLHDIYIYVCTNI